MTHSECSLRIIKLAFPQPRYLLFQFLICRSTQRLSRKNDLNVLQVFHNKRIHFLFHIYFPLTRMLTSSNLSVEKLIAFASMGNWTPTDCKNYELFLWLIRCK